jgi:hypothetical protein
MWKQNVFTKEYCRKISDDNLFWAKSAMTISAKGFPIVAFTPPYKTETEARIEVVQCGDDSCSEITPFFSVEKPAYHPSLLFIKGGYLALVYINIANNKNINYLLCEDNSCSQRKTTSFSNTRGKIATIGPDGLVTILTYNTTEDTIGIIKCYNEPCSENSGIIYIGDDYLKPEIYKVAMNVGNDGYPIIAYSGLGCAYHTVNSPCEMTNLYIIKCAKADCSKIDTFIEANGDFVIGDISIAVDMKGHPIVTFWNSSLLSIFSCGNATCSSGNTLYQMDKDINGSVHDSTIGSDGLLMIAFNDYKSLKLLKCPDAECSGVGKKIEPASSEIK